MSRKKRAITGHETVHYSEGTFHFQYTNGGRGRNYKTPRQIASLLKQHPSISLTQEAYTIYETYRKEREHQGVTVQHAKQLEIIVHQD